MLFNVTAVALEGNTAIASILAVAQQILTAVATMWSAITTWIVGDDLAILYIGMMIIMFAFLGVLTLVKKG